MPKFIKFLLYSIVILLAIWALLVIFLSQIGLETKRFNPIIIDQVKKYDDNLNLDIKTVKIYLNISSLTNPKIKVKFKDPTIILGKNKIRLKTIRTEINILSYLRNNFAIDEFFVLTKDNQIKDLISIAALKKPSLIIYNIFIKEGYANVYGSVNFDQKGNIIDYSFNGEIKNANIKYNEKYFFKNINFELSSDREKTLIQNANFYYKNLKFLSNQIYIPIVAQDETALVKGDIKSEKTKINLNLIKDLFEDDLSFIKNEEIILGTKNKFSFKIKKRKIDELKYSSQIDLENISLSSESNLLKNYFNNSIVLKNNSINLKYEDENLNIEGKSQYSFDNSFDNIDYKIKKKNDNYDFLTLINFDKKHVTIKPINYNKKKNKKSNLKLKGSYNKNKVKFNEIIYNEGKNYLEVRDLNLNKNFKIVDLNKVKLNFLNENNNKNEFTIKKDLTHYNLSGESFDSYNLINNILLSDNEKSFLDNLSLNDETKLNIYLNKVHLNKEHFSKNLVGNVIFNKNKIFSLNLVSEFENNRKFKLDIKTLNNKQKVTSFYSDNAEPFVKHFKFIKGFKEGKIDFYSVKKNNVSNSSLNIFDFKVKEMPALTKLLSLASLQGIADLMTGEGIRFKEFEMNFKNEKKLMTIDEIYAIGPAISILMNGYIESKKLVSLRGTLVPATTLNKVIGSLPLIGKILVGKKTGEGVFGVSFKIKGPPKNLKTTVNPIKTLTPRFITRTIEKAKKN